MAALPSPTPSVGADDRGISQPNLKRQRSASMHSRTSSSSPKRAQSLGPTTQDTTSYAPSLGPPESDVLMSTQVSDAATEVISPAPSPLPGQSAPMWSDVSAQQKVLMEQSFLKDPMEIGETWYLVSMRWYERWRKAITSTEDKDGIIEEKDLGPVDNADLLDGDGNLIDLLVEDENVKFVPSGLWHMLVAWYGESQHPLPRKVRGIGARKEPTLELRPLRFTTLLLVKNDDPSITGPPPRQVTASADSTPSELITEITSAVSSSTPSTHSRAWTILHPRTQIEGLYYPTSRLLQGGGDLIPPEMDKTIEDIMLQSGDVLVIEVQDEAGEWLVDAEKVPVSGQSEEAPPPLFSSENDFFSRMEKSAKVQNKGTSSSISSVVSSTVSSLLLRNKSASTPKTSTSTFSKPKVPGTMGLGNMGNTCFMNSALQCLSHNKELVDYFLTGVYKDELNPDNPLGMQGAIAESFGALLSRIWTSNASSYSPREFKQALQRFAPQFSGYQQHDSQELVAFLLDGLHEDLNRIIKKPYVEKPDWEGGAEKEMVELARKSWEGYLLRNDSVIVDLFQGQYRSTLVCPECSKISITFDPFMYLTLPLPVNKKWRHSIFYVPWDLSKPHLQIAVEINADATFKDVRNLLGRWMGAEPSNLITMEIWHNKFYKRLDNNALVSDSTESDIIVCYELPCNSQQTHGYKRQPEEPFVVPVFLSQATSATARTSYGRSTASLFGYPFFVAIGPSQAKSVDAISAVLTDRLSRWTTQARDLYKWELGPGSGTEVTIPLDNSTLPDAIAEIQENGEVITIEQEPAAPAAPEEGDITDETPILVTQDEDTMDTAFDDAVPRKVGPKSDVFTLRVQGGYTQQNSSYSTYGSYGSATTRYEAWETRQIEEDIPLLKEGDALYCEFDENMQLYYFGEERTRWEHAGWNHWTEFVHEEVAEARKASGEKKTRGITLRDCLDEFTKEEKLGEDDLWYCPQCKKHQQATKKFDIWKVPDILVVHLKRFSSSRALRDKIDTFVDFPVEGLDLESMIHERKVAATLREQGVSLDGLGLGNLEEPMIYDLFAVDEHLGGLGGGHYRAYALNHTTNKWYHFDDSYVTESRAQDAVNANAYLLFYRRRTDRPLGGKTNEKIEEARTKVPPTVAEGENAPEGGVTDGQLPTPPDEDSYQGHPTVTSQRETDLEPMSGLLNWSTGVDLPSTSTASDGSSRGEPPGIEGSSFDAPFDMMRLGNEFDYPNPSVTGFAATRSDNSSNEAVGEAEVVSGTSSPDTKMLSPKASPVKWDGKEIPVEESTLNDIE